MKLYLHFSLRLHDVNMDFISKIKTRVEVDEDSVTIGVRGIEYGLDSVMKIKEFFDQTKSVKF